MLLVWGRRGGGGRVGGVVEQRVRGRGVGEVGREGEEWTRGGRRGE